MFIFWHVVPQNVHFESNSVLAVQSIDRLSLIVRGSPK